MVFGVGEMAVMAATNPATLLAMANHGRLQPGANSDIIVLSDTLELRAVFLAGRALN